MTYEKEHSYLSRIAEKAKKGMGILALTALSYAGLDALLETISPSTKSAQAQEQKDKTLIEKIKEYSTAIKDYETKGDKANADTQRNLLNQEILKEPKSLDEYLKVLVSSEDNITPETLLIATENAEKHILIITDKNTSALATESLYKLLLSKSSQTSTAQTTKLGLLLKEWQYSQMLTEGGFAKYKPDISKAKAGITQIYSSMSTEERTLADKIADLYGLKFLLEGIPQKPAVPEPKKPEVKPEPKPEAKPEPKPEVKPEPKPEPKPEVKPEPKPEVKPEPKPQPKPQPKPEPKKPKPAPTPSIAKPAPQPTQSRPGQQPEESDRPSYIEIGTAINSNQSTQGNTQHASLITSALELRGAYDFLQWRDLQNEMITRATTAGAAEIKPLVITKIADLLGAEIPKELVNFLTVGVAGESQTTTRRKFEQAVTEDSDFKITSDTAVKEKFTDSMVSANATLRLLFLELCAAGNVRPQALTTEVDNAIYIINKKDPAGNHNMNSRTKLENLINEQRVQGEIKYVFETMLGEKIPFTGKIGMLADHTKIKQELADGTDQDTQSTLFGLTAEGKISDAFAFNLIAIEELFNGPGEKNDGWKDTLAYVSLFVRGEGKTVKDIHAKPMYSAKAAGMIAGWVKGENWGAGAGFTAGTGTIDTDYWNSMLADFGRIELGLDRTLGQTLSGMEIERYMRIMPLAFGKGFNIFALGGVRSGRNEDNHLVLGTWGYTGITAGPLDVTGTYEDDHIARRIGGRVGVNFKAMRIALGFIDEKNKRQDDSSQTGVAEVIIPFG